MTAMERFCSDAARSRGDDNAATAARVDVWLLVELARPWGREPLTDANYPEAVRETLLNALTTIPRSRLLFIRRGLEKDARCSVYVVRSGPSPGVAHRELASIAAVSGVDFAAMAAEANDARPPLVLVCTHGQHDPCCGRRGYPLYDALRQRNDLDVWQCSHVGGDRFAANALVLPWGLYYGPVEAEEAGLLADSVVRGEIVVKPFRGRSSFARPVQAAETFVRRSSGIVGRDALTFVRRSNEPDGRHHVTLRNVEDGSLHEVTVEQFTAAPAALATCSASAATPVRAFRLVDYRVTRQA